MGNGRAAGAAHALYCLMGALCVWAAGAAAQEAPPLSGADALLALGADARALGMGGATVGVAELAGTLENPAGLAWLSERRVGGLAERPYGVLDHVALSLTVPRAGLTVVQLGLSGAQETNAFGNPNGRPLTYVGRAAVAGLAFPLPGGLALGVQLKAYEEQNGPLRGFGWALDPGALYAVGPWQFGAVWRHALSDPVRYDNGQLEPWHNGWEVGFSWLAAPWDGVAVRLAGDLNGPLTAPRVELGGELWLADLGLRLGWDGARTWSVGASVLAGDLSLHWGYAFHDALPSTLRLSVSLAY